MGDFDSFEDLKENSLDNSFWKDSFDKLLTVKRSLRSNNLLKKSVNADYNNDSSINNSGYVPSAKKRKTSRKQKLQELKDVSTPAAKVKNKNTLFRCTLSPITSWTYRYFPNSYESLTVENQAEATNSCSNTKQHLGTFQADIHKLSVSNNVNVSIIEEDPVETTKSLQVNCTKSIGSCASLIQVIESDVEEEAKRRSNTINFKTNDLDNDSLIIQQKICNTQVIRKVNDAQRRTRKLHLEAVREENSESVIEIIERPKSFKEKRKTKHQIMSDERNISMTIKLVPGKWRRSLTVWRRERELDDEYKTNKRTDLQICPKPKPYSLKKTSGGLQILEEIEEVMPSKYGRRTSMVSISKNNKAIDFYADPKEKLLRLCEQNEPVDFYSCYLDRDLKYSKKIGEGAYGEVFAIKRHEQDEVVLKIIPIEGDYSINGEPQKTFLEILPEIFITKELSFLRKYDDFASCGFVDLKAVRCVKGKYPTSFLDLWELYEHTNGTENDNPEEFTADQLFVIFELENGGRDLESFEFLNAQQSFSAYIQILLNLTVAEEKVQFEHRDLHWGNVLLKKTNDISIKFKINGKELKVLTHGIKVTIIDYTLSRMNLDGHCLYNDLAKDAELFTATGDYQFEVYRLMKYNLKNIWDKHEPYTNLLWLHYITDKLLNGVKYKRKKTGVHVLFMNLIKSHYETILDYKTAFKFLKEFVYDNNNNVIQL